MHRATAPLRSVNGPGSVPRNRGSKIPQSGSKASGRSSFGGRSSIGSIGKYSVNASNRLSAVQKRSIGGMVTKPATSSRRSSGFGRGYGHETLKDPRPISNKQFKDQSIKKLIEFLASYGYPHLPLSHKMLVSPMTKDFLHIFEFLVSCLDPSFKLGNKPEEEVPITFKRLRYPFAISKSALFAVGSPHTWPSLLGALTWLRGHIEYTIQIDPDKALFQANDFDDGSSEMKYLFEYCESAYKEFLAGADSFEALDAELENKIKTCGEMADMEHVAEENKTLKEQLALLHEQPDQLVMCKQKYNTMSVDVEKVRIYVTQMDQHCQSNADSLQKGESELAQLEAELGALRMDNKKKQHIFETQEFSMEDIQRINLDRERLSQSIETLEGDVKNLDQEIWDLEMSNAKVSSRTETKCAEYNQMCIQLGIMPSSGDGPNVSDFRLTGKIHNYQEEEAKFLKVIKPGLIQLWTQASQEVHQTSEEHITLKDAVDQMSEMENEKLQAISLLEAKHKRQEDAVESEKQIAASGQKSLQESIFKLQDDLIEQRKYSSLSLSKTKRLFEDEKIKFKEEDEKRKNLQKAMCQFLEQVVELIVSHKTSIQDHSAATRAKLEAARQKNLEYIQSKGHLQGKR